jgi:hypothetical protein
MSHLEIFQRSNQCDSSDASKRTAREGLMHSEMADKFRVRFATVDDAEVISRHRARMFQDMGELPANLSEAFRASSCDQLRDLFYAAVTSVGCSVWKMHQTKSSPARAFIFDASCHIRLKTQLRLLMAVTGSL